MSDALHDRAEAWFRRVFGLDADDPLSPHDSEYVANLAAFAREFGVAIPEPLPTKPTPGFEKLSRKEALTNLTWRKAKIEREVRALPNNERFRLVADLIDAGVPDAALQVAKFATEMLEAEKGRGPKAEA